MNRLELHTILCDILGSNNVYFQPPENVRMKYPCIVYSRDGVEEFFANNRLYNKNKRYSVIVIDSNPDSLIPDKVGNLPSTTFVRHYVVENLNHDVYSVYI